MNLLHSAAAAAAASLSACRLREWNDAFKSLWEKTNTDASLQPWQSVLAHGNPAAPQHPSGSSSLAKSYAHMTWERRLQGITQNLHIVRHLHGTPHAADAELELPDKRKCAKTLTWLRVTAEEATAIWIPCKPLALIWLGFLNISESLAINFGSTKLNDKIIQINLNKIKYNNLNNYKFIKINFNIFNLYL